MKRMLNRSIFTVICGAVWLFATQAAAQDFHLFIPKGHEEPTGLLSRKFRSPVSVPRIRAPKFDDSTKWGMRLNALSVKVYGSQQQATPTDDFAEQLTDPHWSRIEAIMEKRNGQPGYEPVAYAAMWSLENTPQNWQQRLLSGNLDAHEGLYIADIGVDPASRGKGYGTKLLKSVIGRAEQAHVPVYLHVAVGNAGAIRLYEKTGFHKIADAPVGISHPTEAALLMRWDPSAK